MSDAIAIATDLPFRAQVVEFIQHLSRSLPTPSDAPNKELLAQFESSIKPSEPGAEIPQEVRQEAVRGLVAKVVELRGALDGPKDIDAESSHLLLQHLISSNFDASSEEYSTLVKKVVEAIKKAGETAWASKRITRHEQASRVLNNTYNYLPSSSPLRPTVLLSLITLLGLSSDLKSLTLSSASVLNSLSQWSISPEEKLAFLTSAASLYARARDSRRALELNLLAIEQLNAGAQAVEEAIVYAIADEKRFVIDDVLRVKGVKENVNGKAKELVGLFEGDVVEAVKKGQDWASANKSWIEGFSIPQFTAEGIVRKLRYIALTNVVSQSSQQVSYSEIAQALSIQESEVELWVIDAIRENLLKARLSQPTSTVRVLSVSSVASRNFGPTDWQLLEKRLQEWKKAVNGVQSVVAEAETLAAQGPITNRTNNRQDRGQRRETREPREKRENREEQRAERPAGGEEITA